MIQTEILTPLKLLTLCYPVIPSGGGKEGKAPLVNWQQFQTEYPTEDDLERWERELHPNLWGIVTGAMSGIVITDVDRPELRAMYDDAGLFPHTGTPRGGFHYWFRHPGYPVKTIAGLLPGIDIRGDGGFVNVIGKRKDGEYKTLIVPTPDAIIPWAKLPPAIAEAIKAGENGHKTEAPANTTGAIPEGQRNHTLTSLGGTMRRRGMSQSTIEAALLEENRQRCNPPLPDEEVITIAASVSKYPPETPTGNVTHNNNMYIMRETQDTESERYKSVTENVTKSRAEVIEEWVKETTGWFSYEDIDKEFNIKTESEKLNRRVIIKRLRDSGTIEDHPKNNKLYRHVNVSVRLVDFKAAGRRSPLAIKYPFGIENHFNTYPGNIIILAGASDAGKTAFLLNVVRANMYDFSIFYQTSEMGADELASRLEKFEGIGLEEWNFTVEERSHDFADVIRPDCVNIIDYLEFAGDYYMIAEYLRAIHDRLKTGIAIVAIQKKRGADLGRGGDLGLEKARLYLTLDSGVIKFQKCKNWVHPEKNPNRLMLNFKLASGCKFIASDDWHHEDDL
jgi:hypothetical protein